MGDEIISRKKNATNFKIPGGTNGFLYQQVINSGQSLAFVSMDGVYPEKGFSINDICTETFFVVDGSLNVTVDKEEFALERHDAIVIAPGKKYKVSGVATVVDFITPQWDSSQNHIIN